jgi:hypothetical protein
MFALLINTAYYRKVTIENAAVPEKVFEPSPMDGSRGASNGLLQNIQVQFEL